MVRTSFRQLRPQQPTPTKEAQSRTPMAKTMSKEKILEVYGVDIRHQPIGPTGRRTWTEELRKQVVAAAQSQKWTRGELVEVLGVSYSRLLDWEDKYGGSATKVAVALENPQLNLPGTDEDEDTDSQVSQEPDTTRDIRAQALSLVNPVGPRIAAGKLAKRAYKRQSRLEHQSHVMEVDSSRAIRFSVSSPEQAIRMLELLQANTMDISKITITIDVIED